MKAVVQRVKNAKLTVDGEIISEIGKGFVVFLGVGEGDSENDLAFIVKKISKLRIFEDENGKMNLDLEKAGGGVLLVSQFTLFADCSQGNRPNFLQAEKPERAKVLYEKALGMFNACGIVTKPGVFGADMKIEQLNDGPVTIILDSRELQK